MTIFSEDQARSIVAKVVSLSKAEQCTAQLQGAIDGNIRFARNNVSTSGITDNTELTVQVANGSRSGLATINQFDDASLERVVRRAEDLAKLAPENVEFVGAVEKQAYTPSETFSAATAAITPDNRAQIAQESIDLCKGSNLTAAGYLQDRQNFTAFANNRGNAGYQSATGLDFTCTVRTDDGRGSGWVRSNLQDSAGLNVASDMRTAIRKASASVDAKAIEPGKYTVILEPAAVAGLLSFMLRYFDARQSDEGRSFLSRKGGGNRLGEQMFDPRVSIVSDPGAPGAAVMPWDENFLPRHKMPLIENGKVANLNYSRYWAQKQGKEALGQPGNFLMAGGTKSTADMVRETERGILVTRTWYIRMVDPQTVLLTGLTRDGTFYVENGEVKYPVKNFRFNESPVIMLNNIDEMGKPVRVGGGGRGDSLMVLPPIRARDFTFTSLSDAI
jgi:predicted Zn-dependent protease